MREPSGEVLSKCTIRVLSSGADIIYRSKHPIETKTYFSKLVPLDRIEEGKKYHVYARNNDVMDEAVIEYIEPYIEKLPVEEQEKWEQVRINAAISILNSLLETTQHSVAEEVVVKDIYARVAVAYADSLVKELRNNKDWIQKIVEL